MRLHLGQDRGRPRSRQNRPRLARLFIAVESPFTADGLTVALEDSAIGVTARFPAEPQGAQVLKQWQKLPNGRTFLVESVGWQDLWPQLQNLPVAQGANNAIRSNRQLARSRVWPARAGTAAERNPIQVASVGYKPKGVLVDFPVSLTGSTNGYTLASGTAYYIADSFTVGNGTAIFQPGCVVKYANDAYLLLYGPVSFQAKGPLMPIFTQKGRRSGRRAALEVPAPRTARLKRFGFTTSPSALPSRTPVLSMPKRPFNTTRTPA